MENEELDLFVEKALRILNEDPAFLESIRGVQEVPYISLSMDVIGQKNPISDLVKIFGFESMEDLLDYSSAISGEPIHIVECALYCGIFGENKFKHAYQALHGDNR